MEYGKLLHYVWIAKLEEKTNIGKEKESKGKEGEG